MTTRYEILKALRSNVEGEFEGWGEVYMDNARADLPPMSDHQWAGYLSALENEGVYQRENGPDQGIWGFVKLDQKAPV